MIKAINAKLVEKLQDIDENTFVIAGDDDVSLRRTPKLMIAFCRTPHIVHLNWLLSSNKIGLPLESNEYLLLSDYAAERRYSFSMKESLANAIIARQNGGILAGWTIYVCKGVAGNRAPDTKELKAIIDAAGGAYITTRPRSSKHVLILSSDPVTEDQKCEHDLVGLTTKMITTSKLFDSLIKQRFEDEANNRDNDIKSKENDRDTKYRSPTRRLRRATRA